MKSRETKQVKPKELLMGIGGQPNCECKSEPFSIYTATGAPHDKYGKRYRIKITIGSYVRCDSGTPQQCEYHYIVKGEVEEQNKGGRNRSWRTSATRSHRVHIRKFTIHGDIKQTIKVADTNETQLEIVLWRPKAPEKGVVEITVEFSPPSEGDQLITINEQVSLCLPELDMPKCP